MMADVEPLYAAGADYVMMSRLTLARELREVLHAARNGKLHEKRAEIDRHLSERREVLA
jgi:hypothetical protein